MADIIGTSGPDALSSGTDTDNLYGLEGNDTLASGTGIHQLFGGEGSDLADFSALTEPLWMDVGAGYVSSPDIYDTFNSIEGVIGGANSDTIYGTGGGDRLYGNAGNDALMGQDGADSLYGGAGDNYLEGDGGDDLLAPGSGNNFLSGGDGFDLVNYQSALAPVSINFGAGGYAHGGSIDTFQGIEGLIGSNFADTILGSADKDLFFGGGGDDSLIGQDGADRLYGGDGDDQLFGGSGSDILTGGPGAANLLDGGAGIDYASYISATVGIVVDLGAGFYASGDGLTFDTFNAIEGVLGGSGNDTLFGSNSVDSRLLGGDGADILTGRAGSDSLYGGVGDDLLSGGTGLNLYDGGAGTDYVDYSAKTGPLWVDLNSGYVSTPDTFDLFFGMEGVIGGSGSDTLLSAAAGSQLYGGAGDDALIGRDGSDYLSAGDGDDVLVGGLGANYLDGGAGTDMVDFSGISEPLYIDLLNGQGSGTNFYDALVSIEGLIGGTGADSLLGDAGDNLLVGGAGDDVLTGREGNEFLYGGDGADALIGGPGNDNLFGGAGADLFNLDGGGWDVAQDFVFGQDQLSLGNGAQFQYEVFVDYNQDGTMDTELTWDGNTLIVIGDSSHSLSDWNGSLV